MKSSLAYMVIEYFPQAMAHDKMIPARIDGHYANREDAQGVADLWAESPAHDHSRIVVVEVLYAAKDPEYWQKRGAA